MEKDRRYDALKVLIDTGHIKHFNEIFNVIPKSLLRQDLKINNTRITRLIDHPEQLTLDESVTIANLIGIDVEKIIRLVLDQFMFNKSKAKAKK